MEKMTNVKALDFVLTMEGIVLPTDVREKLVSMKASFVKKSNAERKPTATQKENEGFKVSILDFLETKGACTITDIMKGVPALADLSNQRVSAIVRQLKEDGFVVRTEANRKAFFSLAIVETDDDEEIEEVEGEEIEEEGGEN